MVEEDPGLVEDQQRRPAVEALLEPVEQIGEHRRDHTRLAEQRLGLEALHVGESEPAFRGIQQPAVGSIERIGLDRSAQRRSEEHTSELQSLMRISYAVFCLKKKKQIRIVIKHNE